MERKLADEENISFKHINEHTPIKMFWNKSLKSQSFLKDVVYHADQPSCTVKMK